MDERKRQKLREAIGRYAPPEAVERLAQYIEQRAVHVRITPPRSSKLGDYRPPQGTQPYHAISVNSGLTPPFFLWVMLHEMAHLEAYLHYGNRIQPHGLEWQAHYRSLIRAYHDCMPDEAQPLIDRYIAQLPLHRSSGQRIDQLLRHYGQSPAQAPDLTLDDLPAGSRFRLAANPRQLFVSIERRRTRWVCKDTATGRLYSVKGSAEVMEE